MFNKVRCLKLINSTKVMSMVYFVKVSKISRLKKKNLLNL